MTEVVNAQNHRGETALWLTTLVASSKFPNMIQAAAMLLNAGADPNIPSNVWSNHGVITPLEMALKNNNRAICRLLLLAGARPALLSETVKGRKWLGGISIMIETKELLHAQNEIDFVVLVADRKKLLDMTFSDLEFIHKCNP